MDDHSVLVALHAAVDAVVEVLSDHDDWGPSGQRHGQYASDVVADRAAVEVLLDAGLRVLSEESGMSGDDGPVAVLDPLDGSTNASLGLPWYATSVCVVDEEGPWAAVVHDHPSEVRFDAVRRGGARRDGEPMPLRDGGAIDEAIVAVNGLPPGHPGWAQFRCMGAAALDLCAVAEGRFDAYVDHATNRPWDYLGGMLLCREVGLDVVDGDGRDLVTLDPEARRSPVAGPADLVAILLESRNEGPGRDS